MSSPWTVPGASAQPHEAVTAAAPGAAAAPPIAEPAPQSGPQRELIARQPLFPLRPMGLGEILGAAVRIYRERGKLTLGLSAVVYGVSYLLMTIATSASLVPFIGQMQTAIEDPSAQTADVPMTTADLISTVAASAVSGVMTLIASALVTLALTAIAIGAATGERTDWPQVRQLLRRRWLQAILIAAAAGLLGLVALLLFTALGAIPLLIIQQPTLLTILPMIAGFALGLLASLYIVVRTALAIPSLAIEGRGIGGSMRRSFALTQGRRLWRIGGIYLLIVLIAAFATQIVSGVFGTVGTIAYIALLLASSGQQMVLALIVLTIVSMAGAFAATVLLAPFQSAGCAALYADARMRHEAWDIELTERARAARAADSAVGAG